MTIISPRTFTAGGKRFREGQEFLATSCVDDRVWVIEDSSPAYYSARRHNLVWGYQQDRPGIYNTFEAADIVVIEYRCGSCNAPLVNDCGVGVHPLTKVPHTCQEA